MFCKRTILLLLALFPVLGSAQVRIAQLSDTHVGLAKAPNAADNLRRAVQIINDRGVDVVVVSGDIGENPRDWEEAREILGHLRAPVHYIPGNHDIHSNDFDRYRHVFGDDFYRFQIKNVVVYGLDSEVFGNYDSYDAAKVALPPLSEEARENQAREMRWLEESAEKPMRGERAGDGEDHLVVIGMQHIPIARDGNFPPDPRPYWTIPEQDRERECQALKRLGIHDMLVGHWHNRREFEYCGIRWHVAAATSWGTWNGELGFDIFTISPDGHLKDDFISLGH